MGGICVRCTYVRTISIKNRSHMMAHSIAQALLFHSRE